MSSISSTSSCRAITGRRSTSPIPPSAWESECSSWTCFGATKSPSPRLRLSNVLPRLLHIGSFSVQTYGVIVATAYLVAICLLNRKPQAEGLPKEKILDLSLYVLTAAILGAKILLVVVEWRRYLANPRDLIEVVQSA